MNNKFLMTLALCLCSSSLAYAQKRISGRVWSKQDGPIVMAYVVEQDKNNRNVTAVQTDANGNFSMVVKNPANKLRISYIGYQTKVLNIGENAKFNVELIDKNTFKDAVVTVTRKTRSNGLVIPEREISTAQQTLDMDQMAGLSFETAADALQGEIAGLDIVSNSGNLGSGSSMRLRGVSSINGSQEPLIVVDGNILEDYSSDELDFDNMENEEQFATLLQVAPEDIGSIKVLKDAAATAIYGARGSNGVIEITTRRGARGKTRVNFSYCFSGSWQPEGMKMLDGDGYTMMLKEAYHNPRILSEEDSSLAEIMNIIGEVKGRTCVITDDIVDTAGTLCNAAGALKERGAKRVVAYITHPVLSGAAVERIMNSALDELVVTDTIPLSAAAEACQKIRQVSCAAIIGETLSRIAREDSVSNLFTE